MFIIFIDLYWFIFILISISNCIENILRNWMNDNFVSQLTDNCPQIICIHSIIDNRRQNGIYIYKFRDISRIHIGHR